MPSARMNRSASPRILLPGLALLLLLAGVQPARAQGNLRVELTEVAKSLKKLLDGRGESTVAVGQFTGPAHFPASAGPAISRMLSEELGKANVTVKVRANLTVEGRYKDITDKQTGLLAAQLKVKVLDRRDEIVVEFERGIFGDATLASLFGLTTQLPPAGNARERSKQLEDALDNPHSHIVNAEISATPGSPFALVILVKKAGDPGEPQPRAAEQKEGLAFVPIRRGEVYEVRLLNRAEHEAAVSLTIDGLSIFTFSDVKAPNSNRPRYTVVFVPPGKSITIKGWHRTNEHSEEFLVTEYAKSAAAELKSTANIGTITACFAASWPRDGTPPADEPPNPGEHARSADATGRGAQVGASYVEVQRHFGVVRATVSVRYTK